MILRSRYDLTVTYKYKFRRATKMKENVTDKLAVQALSDRVGTHTCEEEIPSLEPACTTNQ